MKYALAVLMVLAAAAPAFSRDLMTTGDTPVRAKPRKNAAVLTTIKANVRIPFDKRKDNWFRVTVDVDGKAVTGWVNRKHVTDLMGRSKGQLLAENKRLYDEVVELRKTTKKLQADLAAAQKQRAASDAKLRAALDLINQLQPAAKPKVKP